MSTVVVDAGVMSFSFVEGSVGWGLLCQSLGLINSDILVDLRSKAIVGETVSGDDLRGEHELFLSVLDFIEFINASGVQVNVALQDGLV